MTIIKPNTAQDIATSSKLQEAVQKANLNLPEVVALNKKFGTNLEYIPTADVIEFTTYYGKKIPASDDLFHKECANMAVDMALKLKKTLVSKIRIDNSAKTSLQASLNSAIKKLKSVMR